MNCKQSYFLSIVEDFVDYYLPIGKGLSDNTIKSYKYAFRLLIEYMYAEKHISADKIEFSNLDYDTLSGFFDWILNNRNCSTSTRNQRLSALLSFSSYAQNRDFDAAATFRNSILKIPIKKTAPPQIAWFTSEEMKIFLALPNETKATDLRDKVLLCTMYATGARAQEICDLTVSSIKFSQNQATVDIIGKGNKRRRIKVSSFFTNILKSYLSKRKILNSPTSHIFSSQTHEKMTISCIEEVMKKYVSIAKNKYPEKFLMSSYTPHSIRHTTAIHMLESGVPIMAIKNFLGHATVQTTEIYAKLTQNTVDKYILEWNEKWFPKDRFNINVEISRPDKMPEFLKP